MATDSADEPAAALNGAEASEQSAAQDKIIKKVMQELVFHSRAEVSLSCARLTCSSCAVMTTDDCVDYAAMASDL